MTNTSGQVNGHAGGQANSHASCPLDWSKFQNIVDGRLETTAETRHSINPATGEPGPEVPLSTKDDLERVMFAAKQAFKGWAATSWEERAQRVLDYADALESEGDRFADMLVNEQGKPMQFAKIEIQLSLHWMRTLAQLSLPEERIVEEDKETIVRYTPLGVTVGIVPWNYPILLAVGKIAPAVITGNTIVIKPSPFTPAGDLKLCELAQRFFPPGVVQCLSGDDNLGPWMTSHSVPAKVSFTGSTATGKKVMESCSRTLKRVTLELGGKDPAIICEDVDIGEVAAKVATFAFLNSGQVKFIPDVFEQPANWEQICLALKRIYVHATIFDEFSKALAVHAQKLKVGEGHEQDVFLGPIQNAAQYDRVKGFFEDISINKMDVVVGGKIPDGKGYFITPTIINQPSHTSRIAVEEPFGPIIPLFRFESDEQAIDLANDTTYGLGASVWSKDVGRANEIGKRLEAGNVWINTHFELDPRVPFGGHKESGIGSEWGIGGLKAYCNSQTLYLKRA